MNNKGNVFVGIVLTIIAIGIIGLLGYLSFYMTYGNEQTIECTVKDKWTKRTSSNGSDLYLVSCDDEVYEISDLMFKGKFDSANIYAGLEKGKKYKITVTGFRFGFFSMYQNINNYKEVKSE